MRKVFLFCISFLTIYFVEWSSLDLLAQEVITVSTGLNQTSLAELDQVTFTIDIDFSASNNDNLVIDITGQGSATLNTDYTLSTATAEATFAGNLSTLTVSHPNPGNAASLTVTIDLDLPNDNAINNSSRDFNVFFSLAGDNATNWNFSDNTRDDEDSYRLFDATLVILEDITQVVGINEFTQNSIPEGTIATVNLSVNFTAGSPGMLDIGILFDEDNGNYTLVRGNSDDYDISVAGASLVGTAGVDERIRVSKPGANGGVVLVTLDLDIKDDGLVNLNRTNKRLNIEFSIENGVPWILPTGSKTQMLLSNPGFQIQDMNTITITPNRSFIQRLEPDNGFANEDVILNINGEADADYQITLDRDGPNSDNNGNNDYQINGQNVGNSNVVLNILADQNSETVTFNVRADGLDSDNPEVFTYEITNGDSRINSNGDLVLIIVDADVTQISNNDFAISSGSVSTGIGGLEERVIISQLDVDNNTEIPFICEPRANFSQFLVDYDNVFYTGGPQVVTAGGSPLLFPLTSDTVSITYVLADNVLLIQADDDIRIRAEFDGTGGSGTVVTGDLDMVLANDFVVLQTDPLCQGRPVRLTLEASFIPTFVDRSLLLFGPGIQSDRLCPGLPGCSGNLTSNNPDAACDNPTCLSPNAATQFEFIPLDAGNHVIQAFSNQGDVSQAILVNGVADSLPMIANLNNVSIVGQTICNNNVNDLEIEIQLDPISPQPVSAGMLLVVNDNDSIVYETPDPNPGIRTNITIPIDTLPEGTYTIVYEARDDCDNGDTTAVFNVLAGPAVNSLGISNNCSGQETTFNPQLKGGVNAVPDLTRLVWNWDFGDGQSFQVRNSASVPVVSHVYSNARPFNLRLTITDTLNNVCPFVLDTTIVIDETPSPSFAITQRCDNASSLLSPSGDYSNFPLNTDIEWQWTVREISSLSPDTMEVKVGTATNPNAGNFDYPFPGAGTYEVNLQVGVTNTTSACTESNTQIINILPFIEVSSDSLYAETFTGTTATWFAGPNPDSASWELRARDGTGFPGGSDRAWVTFIDANEVDALGSQYFDLDTSFVESPCFDLQNVNLPVLELEYQADLESGTDGVAVQYSFEGDNWNLLGDDEIRDSWYNQRNILGRPGGAVNDTNRVGWSGQNLETRSARISIEQVKQDAAGRPVRFRLIMGANSGNISRTDANDSNNPFKGFAFDNVQINEQERQVLLEHFSNSQDALARNADQILQATLRQNSDFSSVIPITYLTNFPFPETTLIPQAANRADISARGLLYGVSELPRTIIDGILSNPSGQIFEEGNWGVVELTEEVLKSPRVRIEPIIDAGQSNALALTVNLSRAQTLFTFEESAVLQVLVVELLPIAGDTIASLIARKFIPVTSGAAGVQRYTEQELNNNAFSDSVPISWVPFETINPGQYAVISFFQGEQSREIYQANITTINHTINPGSPLVFQEEPREGLGPEHLRSSDLHVYPNPSAGLIYLDFQQELEVGANWLLIDPLGREAARGFLPRLSGLQEIQNYDVKPGVYTLHIGNARKRLIIAPK